MSAGKRIQTMQGLAQQLGLSRQTLSKYFNNPDSVSAKTRAQIEAAVEGSGFRPNLFAANLKRRQSRVIGVIVPSTVDPFFMQLAHQISRQAELSGYFALILSSDGKAESEAQAAQQLQSLNIAGALVAPLGKTAVNPAVLRLAEHIPLIYIDTPPLYDAAFVGTDNYQSIDLLVEYFCQHYPAPSFLSMPAINQNAALRLAAYEEAMMRRHEAAKVITISEEEWQFEAYGYAYSRRWLKQKGEKSLLCANDRLAFGALLAAWEAGERAGEAGLYIAGHDDHPLSAYSCPPLTTAAQNSDLLAQSAIGSLLKQIEEPQSRLEQIYLPAQLILRRSA